MNGSTAGRKIEAYLNLPDPKWGEEEAAKPENITLQNVCFSYDGKRNVLNHVNLTLKPGLQAIVGASGSGKSTIVPLLLGAYEPQEGQVLYKEREASKGYVAKGNKDTFFNYHIPMVGGAKERKEEKDVDGNDFVIDIRPEALGLSEAGAGLPATVYSVMPSGMETTMRLDIDNFLLTSVVFGKMRFTINETIHVDFASDNILLFDKKSEQCIAHGSLAIAK